MTSESPSDRVKRISALTDQACRVRDEVSALLRLSSENADGAGGVLEFVRKELQNTEEFIRCLDNVSVVSSSPHSSFQLSSSLHQVSGSSELRDRIRSVRTKALMSSGLLKHGDADTKGEIARQAAKLISTAIKKAIKAFADIANEHLHPNERITELMNAIVRKLKASNKIPIELQWKAIPDKQRSPSSSSEKLSTSMGGPCATPTATPSFDEDTPVESPITLQDIISSNQAAFERVLAPGVEKVKDPNFQNVLSEAECEQFAFAYPAEEGREVVNFVKIMIVPLRVTCSNMMKGRELTQVDEDILKRLLCLAYSKSEQAGTHTEDAIDIVSYDEAVALRRHLIAVHVSGGTATLDFEKLGFVSHAVDGDVVMLSDDGGLDEDFIGVRVTNQDPTANIRWLAARF